MVPINSVTVRISLQVLVLYNLILSNFDNLKELLIFPSSPGNFILSTTD